MAPWAVPTVVYLFCVGSLGVTAKLALRTLQWPDLVLWAGCGYVLVAGVLLILGRTQLRFVEGSEGACVSAVAAIGGLIALYLALGAGDASKVAPITAAYPAVTLILSAIFLSEPISLARA